MKFKTNMSDDYTNVLTNVITPVDPRRTDLLLGSLEYVAAEVIVAKLVRKIIKADNKGWAELAYVHTLSLPFMGGAGAFFDGSEPYEGTDKKGEKIGFSTQLMDGAKGIPAVLLAQYIMASFTKGFHTPWFNMKDLLITAGTKAITRPVVGFVYSYLPTNVQDNLVLLEILFSRQRDISTVKSKDK